MRASNAEWDFMGRLTGVQRGARTLASLSYGPGVNRMIKREGGKIASAFESHLAGIEGRLGKVAARVPLVVDTYQKRLDDRIQQLLTQRGLEAAKLDIVKEVAIHADRCDTSEEIQRLKSHIGEFRKITAQKGQLGRRLDFLTQEMGRETNTIASKANDGEIAASAVEMKAELEKIKEQVENVE